MILPSFLRINKGDYPQESRNIVDRLAGSLNIAIESLFNLANRRISLRDNIACKVVDITLTVDANGFPLNPSIITLDQFVPIADGSYVEFARNLTNRLVYPTGQPFISFTQNGSQFEINHVTGLPANNQFLLRVIIWAR